MDGQFLTDPHALAHSVLTTGRLMRTERPRAFLNSIQRARTCITIGSPLLSDADAPVLPAALACYGPMPAEDWTKLSASGRVNFARATALVRRMTVAAAANGPEWRAAHAYFRALGALPAAGAELRVLSGREVDRAIREFQGREAAPAASGADPAVLTRLIDSHISALGSLAMLLTAEQRAVLRDRLIAAIP